MHIIKEHNVLVDKPYANNFKELAPEYVLEKGQKIENFYNDYIKKSGYTGSFLVAQNGVVCTRIILAMPTKRKMKK